MKNIENDAYGHFPYLIAVRIRDISGSDKKIMSYIHNVQSVRNTIFLIFFARFGIIARG